MKYKIFILTQLAAIGFYNYHGIFPLSAIRVMTYLAIFIGLAYSVYQGRDLRDNEYPRFPYLYLLFGIGFSSVIASLTHMQGLIVSFQGAIVYLIPYLFLFVYLKMDLSGQKVMNIYIVLCLISSVVYFCNVFTMPLNMFGTPILDEDFSRGIIRIPVVFIEIFPLLVFYGINKWLDTKEKKWFVLIAFATLMIFLSVIRQIIAITGVLAVFFLFRNISWYKKFIMVVFIGVIVVFVLPQIPIYKTMVELSEDQSADNDNEEDIRIQAWRFYTYENQESPLDVIFGNGVPSVGNSTWGNIFDSEAETSGRFPHDVGWAGFFFFFGILTTTALLLLIIKAIMHPKPQEMKFINYWLMFILITSVASAPILYWNQIINVLAVIGMAYSPFGRESVGDGNEKDDSLDSSVRASLHFNPFRRYPQLQKSSGRDNEESSNELNS